VRQVRSDVRAALGIGQLDHHAAGQYSFC
jgi:hypothetical protein